MTFVSPTNMEITSPSSTWLSHNFTLILRFLMLSDSPTSTALPPMVTGFGLGLAATGGLGLALTGTFAATVSFFFFLSQGSMAVPVKLMLNPGPSELTLLTSTMYFSPLVTIRGASQALSLASLQPASTLLSFSPSRNPVSPRQGLVPATELGSPAALQRTIFLLLHVPSCSL